MYITFTGNTRGKNQIALPFRSERDIVSPFRSFAEYSNNDLLPLSAILKSQVIMLCVCVTVYEQILYVCQSLSSAMQKMRILL